MNMVYRVDTTINVKKTIAEQRESDTRTMLTEACDYLINFPDISNVKKLKGEENSWRYRKGDWRFIFTLEHKIVDDKIVNVVVVNRISQRKDAY